MKQCNLLLVAPTIPINYDSPSILFYFLIHIAYLHLKLPYIAKHHVSYIYIYDLCNHASWLFTKLSSNQITYEKYTKTSYLRRNTEVTTK
jgi:hypothetical protein